LLISPESHSGVLSTNSLPYREGLGVGFVRFLKISVSFTSLIPSLIPPRELRPTTERRATQLLAYEKCCLLRLLPKRLTQFPRCLTQFLKNNPRLYTLHFTPHTRKIALKAIFICISAKKAVSLRNK
jgi:hypothetical protein